MFETNLKIKQNFWENFFRFLFKCCHFFSEGFCGRNKNGMITTPFPFPEQKGQHFRASLVVKDESMWLTSDKWEYGQEWCVTSRPRHLLATNLFPSLSVPRNYILMWQHHNMEEAHIESLDGGMNHHIRMNRLYQTSMDKN